jgi:H+-transporting ATPase
MITMILIFRYIFVEQLWQPMPIMIWMAAIVEAGIQNYADMAILLFIQLANASIGFYEITKAGDAVAALKASLQVRKHCDKTQSDR